jgi:hypothetical protein
MLKSDPGSRRIWPLLAYGSAAVLLLDFAGSLISRSTGISYGYFAIPSALIYIGIGIIGAHRTRLLPTVCAAIAIAVVDAILGGWIAMRLGVLHLPGDMSAFALTMRIAIAVQSGIAVAAAAITHAVRPSATSQ